MADEAWVDTVRLARELGDVSQILPDGVRTIRNAPYMLFQGIKAGLMFLNFEEMRPEDIPPRNIWTDGEALNEWFEDVRRRQKEGNEGREIEDPVSNSAIDILVK